jgi:hypothetical protein
MTTRALPDHDPRPVLEAVEEVLGGDVLDCIRSFDGNWRRVHAVIGTPGPLRRLPVVLVFGPPPFLGAEPQ